MPLATASQAVMPPKTLTKTDLTCGSPRMMCRPLDLGGGLERVRGLLVLERRVVGLTEVRVGVEGHLAVEGDDLAVLGLHERVDLDERRVLVAVDNPELLEGVGQGDAVGFVEAGRVEDLVGLGLVDADVRVDTDAGEGLGALDGELLDVHAALLGAHGQVGAVRAVEQDREVVLLGDPSTLGDHHTVDGVPLDVHAEDLLSELLGFLGRLGDLHPTGLPTAPGLDLGLHHGHAAGLLADLLGRGACLGRGGGDRTGQHGDPVLLEHITCLVLEEVHERSSLISCR